MPEEMMIVIAFIGGYMLRVAIDKFNAINTGVEEAEKEISE